jgi:hypothetical protein
LPFKCNLQRYNAGSRELEAIHGERVKLGNAIESVEQHLTSEKSLFAQLRTDGMGAYHLLTIVLVFTPLISAVLKPLYYHCTTETTTLLAV